MLKIINNLRKRALTCYAMALLFPVLFMSGALAQSQGQPDAILQKKQQEFTKWKYGIFLHFNIATYINREWANGYEDPLLFNPQKLDCNQWASLAKSAGMKYGVLTVKHTGGWCLWDSKYTNHDITAFKNYKDGHGDIVRDFVDAFRKKGLKVGLYYCMPGDYSRGYGKTLEPGQFDLHGLPTEAGGDYEGFIEKQITELLTNYGAVDLLWFDQYTNKYNDKYWLRLKVFIHKLQPNCVVLANNSNNYRVSDILSYEYPFRKMATPDQAVPPPGNKNVSELCDCIDADGIWFWHTGAVTLQKAQVVSGLIKMCNARNTNYLLDVPPNRDGLIGKEFVQRLMEIKKLVVSN